MDPATVLPTAEFVDNGLPRSTATRVSEIELGNPDVNKVTAPARGPRAAGLAQVTVPELDRSTHTASCGGRAASPTSCGSS